jgi:DNA-binding transcriptional LysR family regulator
MRNHNDARIEQIQAFVAVARYGSFAAAANSLDRDSSIVTRRLAALEQRLGVRLFERSTRRVALTESGERYLSRMQTLLEQLEEADLEAAAQSRSPRGKVKLTMPVSFGRSCVVPELHKFTKLFPDIELDIQLSDRYVNLIEESVDLAIRIGQLSDSSLVARKVADFDRKLYAAPSYLLKRSSIKKPEDLTEHTAIHFSNTNFSDYWKVTNGQRTISCALNTIVSVNDSQAMVSLAEQGIGVICAGSWLVDAALRNKLLMPILPSWRAPRSSSVFVITPSARQLPQKTRVVVDWLVELLRD